MARVLLDDVVHTDYGCLDLAWGPEGGFAGDADRWFAGQHNGLVGAAVPDGVYVSLARRSGGSRVTVVLHEASPPQPSDRYEDVVEVSVLLPDGADVGWVSWGGQMSGTLTGTTAGPHRLRVSAHGRDAGRVGEVEPGVVDDYLLELWPAPAEQDAVLRVGSDDARYWHREWGGRGPSDG